MIELTFKLTKNYRNSFWIDTATFYVKKGQIGDEIPVEAIIVVPEKEKLPNNMIIDVIKCHIVDKSGKTNQVSKKDATEVLMNRMKESMIKKKEWPPYTGIKQVYKNGSVKIEYNPVKNISFNLKIPSSIKEETTVEFLKSLEFPDEQAVVDESWVLRSRRVNPVTMMIKQNVDDLPDREIIAIEERGHQDEKTGKFLLRNHYYAVHGSSSKKITEEEAKDILADQLHVYAGKSGRWPSTAKLDNFSGTNSVSVSFRPAKGFHLSLLLTEKHETDVKSFVESLKTSDDIIQEAESKIIWKVEHAKSGRAACRECGEKIEKGELRIGEPSMYMEHLSYKWYHVDCAGRRSFYMEPVTGLDELSDVEKQEIIKLGLIDE